MLLTLSVQCHSTKSHQGYLKQAQQKSKEVAKNREKNSNNSFPTLNNDESEDEENDAKLYHDIIDSIAKWQEVKKLKKKQKQAR